MAVFVQTYQENMAEPLLEEVFGGNAYQDNANLTINKANLLAVGLVPTANNTAESLLMAIILLASKTLTETARSGDYVNRNVTVYQGGTDLPTQAGQLYRRDQFSVLAYRPSTLTPVDPNDY